ncbi:nitroreductase family protein [Kitasatospora sp. NPDC052896]|uniref:nitroreductase family protein n=1 Tax=Kitasatospora sp. NPDC052896 TaxID=3364061 RepID=UPI0037CBDC82
MGYAHEYAAAVLWRGRAPMEPADFVPDWADRPRKDKYFPGAPHFPLPDRAPDASASVQRGLFGPGGEGGFTLPLLGGMLRDSYGLTGRRLAVQANSDLGSLPLYPHANWSRGTASGGGLYPIGVHWVCGAGGPLLPGVYHYATPHHSMRRLLTGDVTTEVRAALGVFGAESDQFLVLTIKFWQNAFKYNSFSYHAVTMDVGALLETWRIWAGAQGLHLGAALWFDEERLGRLLGLRPDQEGVFAVVPLRWARPPGASGPGTPRDVPGTARVRAIDQERSRTVRTFETVRRLHAATLDGAADRPATGLLDAALHAPTGPERAHGEPVPLPAPRPLALGVRAALRTRRSSFGRFTANPPMTAAQLSTALAAAAAAGRLRTCAESPGEASLTRLHVLVNHVAGVPAGAYAYQPLDGSLRPVRPGPQGWFLQRNYFLGNYNLEQAGAVITVTAPTPAVLDAVGDRGLRLVNAAVGASAQALYTAAPAAGLACGVALGFDGVSYAEWLGLADGELPLLIMMVGQEHRSPADFDHTIA